MSSVVHGSLPEVTSHKTGTAGVLMSMIPNVYFQSHPIDMTDKLAYNNALRMSRAFFIITFVLKGLKWKTTHI